MPSLTQIAPLDCPRCRQPQPRGTHHCMHCGARMVAQRAESRRRSEDARLVPWVYLGLGLVSAPALAYLPVLSFMGWFLSSLVHEMGHTAAALLCGMPAFPAISLEGHAAALHSEQLPGLALLVTALLVCVLWRALEGRARWIACGATALLHPLLAFTPAREVLHLLAGHLAEFGISCVFLFRALSGGFTHSRTERVLHGTLGWFLLGRNLSLCWGLMTSTGARALYHTNGSFGLTNDYIRLADDVLDCPLQTVAGGMLLVGVCTLPAAWLLWRLYLRAQR